MTLEQIRERDAKQASAFYAAETDRHPHGLSGRNHLLPYVNDKRNGGYCLSEWRRLSGSE